MKCSQGKTLQVLQSAAGYYIGTVDDSDGFEDPYCRCSGYYPDRDSAVVEIDLNLFEQRDCVENNYCNLGKGCI